MKKWTARGIILTLALIGVVLASFSFSAETQQYPLEYDQFGLPHDTSPGTGGFSVYGNTIHDSDMVGFSFRKYLTSDGSTVSIYGDDREFAVYDQNAALVDTYAQLLDQNYLETLKDSIYGSKGSHKVHLTGSRTTVFAKRSNGHMDIVGFLPIDLVKRGGMKAVRELGVKLANAEWDETISDQDIYILAPPK